MNINELWIREDWEELQAAQAGFYKLLRDRDALLKACSHGAAVLHAVHTGNVPRGLIPHIDSERILRDAIARAKGDQ